MDITDIDVTEWLTSEEQEERSKQLIEASKAFMQSCGKEKLEVYRIEQFTPTLQPKDSHGKFYTGDSYVVLRKHKKHKQGYDIHYWHGDEATVDEIGSSAAFTVQLSGALSQESTHHLEEQGFESEKFLSYFKKTGVTYLPGGVESGFNMVEEKPFEPRLLHVKGERYPRCFSVDVKASSINTGDVFIFDHADKIYFYAGEFCNIHEKMKGLEVATNIYKSERHCQVEIVHPRDHADIEAEFWELLGGKPDTINPPTSDDIEEDDDTQYQLYRVYISKKGNTKCKEITERPLTREMLETTGTYILELKKQISIWIGHEADPDDKKNALLVGKGFLKSKNKPKGTRVIRIVENAEDVHFKSFFNNFYPIIQRKGGDSAGLDMSVEEKQCMETLAKQGREAVEKLFNKLGQYTVKVYLCKDGENVEIPEEEHGHFFKDEVYIIDVQGEHHRYVVQWAGPRLTGDLVSAYREYTSKLTGGIFEPAKCTRLTVQQGHEDDTLLDFFPAGFICHAGPYADKEQRLKDIVEWGAMYKIEAPLGAKPWATQQDDILCENLNANDAFVIISKGGEKVYYWLGEGSNDDEKNYAKALPEILCPSAAVKDGFEEHSEPEEFWDIFVNGKTEYGSLKALGVSPGFEPRLFQASTSQGYFHMKEIYNFCQEDLDNYAVMVLDLYMNIYIWVGLHSNKIELNQTRKKIQEYVEHIGDGRDINKVAYIEIDPCGEPLAFAISFPEWYDEYSQEWLAPDPYQAALDRIAAEKAAYLESYKEEEKTYDAPATEKYDIEVLKASCPEGVHPAKKEQYLSDEQFQEAFGMTLDEFNELKDWKKKKIKQEIGLW